MEERKRLGIIPLLPILICSLCGCQQADKLPKTTPNTAYFIRIDKNTKNAKLRVLSQSEEVYFAQAGDLLFISAVLDNGYVLNHFTLNGEAIDGASFIMPEDDVTVGISLRYETNKISIGSLKGGKIETDKKEAAYGDIVNVTVTPDQGYYCLPNSLKMNDHVIYRSPIFERTTFSITMPTVSITLFASFMAREAA